MPRALFVLLCIAILATTFAVCPVWAATKNWNVGTGNWNAAGNWSPAGVPGTVTVDTVNISPADGVARTVTYDYAGAPINLGVLTIDLTGAGANRTTISMAANNLTTTGFLLGSSGRATFDQSGGIVTGNNAGLDSVIGHLATGNGIYNLSGTGALSVARDLYVGNLGRGTFNQTGGTTSVAATLRIGAQAGSTGTSTISNSASLTANNAIVGNSSIEDPGALTIQDQASVYLMNNLSIQSFSNVNLNGGTLRFNTVGGTAGLNNLHFNAGTIQLAGNRNLGSDSVITTLYGSMPTISSGKGLTVEGIANIGAAIAETVLVNGGRLTAQSLLRVGGAGNGVLQVTNGGTVVGTGNGLSIGGSALGRTGSVIISGAGSSMSLQNGVGVGAVLGGSGGSLVISDGGSLNSASALIGGLEATTNGTATVTGPGSSWNLPDSPLSVGSIGTGTLNIQNQALVHVGTDLFINPNGTVNLDGGTLRFDTLSDSSNRLNFNYGTIQLAGNRGLGSDAVITRFFGVTPTITTGKGLTVEGTATISTALTLIGGTFRANNLVVNGSLHFGGGLLEITGGTITGLASLAVPSGGEFRASGVQALRVTGAAGSTITATGDLTLGNAAAVNGFGTQGTLQVGANGVTLLDANDVVFDSLALATLGEAGSPGTLDAANGMTLDFGGNVTGYGTVSTTNNLAKPLINNGHITGDSLAEPITLSGYVKGVGTFDNVNFTGTFAPGLSPAILSVGNLAFSPTSTLIMELGGTSPGSGYDQLKSSGTIALDGTLELALINGFIPTAGQTFDIFNGGMLSGAFSALVLPTIDGLAWNTSELANGMLSLTPAGLPGDYNQNGTVDAADYTVWRDGLGSTYTEIDYDVWKMHFGESLGGSGAIGLGSASPAVPEPTTLVMLLVAMLAVCSRRRLAVS